MIDTVKNSQNKILAGIVTGIKTVVYADNKYDGTPSVEASKRLMNAAGVRYYQYQPTGKKLEIEV